MKEVDPDVAALLEDLPKTTLPPILREKGWGELSMSDTWKDAKPPTEGNQQPVYDHTCAQCGRPITFTNRMVWKDHASKLTCDAGIIAERVSDYHVIDDEVEILKRTASFRQEYPMLRVSKPDTPPAGPCSANGRWRKDHQCHCSPHKEGHFGFHECRQCGRLWK